MNQQDFQKLLDRLWLKYGTKVNGKHRIILFIERKGFDAAMREAIVEVSERVIKGIK